MENNNARKLNWFDWFLILGTTLVSIASSLLGEGWDTLGFIVAVTGIVNLVLCAKGNIWNYAFGIVYNAIYVYIAWHSKLYADSAIYLLYYLPMQFVGWAQWKKNQNQESGAVNARHLTGRMALILLAVAAVLIPALARFGDHGGLDPGYVYDGQGHCGAMVHLDPARRRPDRQVADRHHPGRRTRGADAGDVRLLPGERHLRPHSVEWISEASFGPTTAVSSSSEASRMRFRLLK